MKKISLWRPPVNLTNTKKILNRFVKKIKNSSDKGISFAEQILNKVRPRALRYSAVSREVSGVAVSGAATVSPAKRTSEKGPGIPFEAIGRLNPLFKAKKALGFI